MNEQFDPYAPDNVAGGSDNDGLFFGEVVLYRGFQGIWIFDSTIGKNKLWDYDPGDDEHKAAIASGKKVFVYYAIQFFPVGVSFETWVENLANFSDEWKEFSQSLATLWGIEVKSDEFSDKLRKWAGQSIYGKWQSEVVEQKDKAGINRKKYIKRMVEFYPDLATAQAAYDTHKGIDGTVDAMPEGASVKVMERAQALGFVRTWVVNNKEDGKIDLTALQAFIDSIPMLGTWEISDPDIQAIVNELDGVPF